jgi:hypothetical protein
VQAGLKARDAALDEVVLTDVMPYTLGIATVERDRRARVADRFSPIIERNTPVPVSRVQHYGTVQDHQRQIRIDVRQGESRIASNLQRGALEIEVPPAPAGQVGVRVRFSYDANGLLEVDAQANDAEGMLGEWPQLELRTHGAQMSNEELQAARTGWPRSSTTHARSRKRWLIERAKRLYRRPTGRGATRRAGLARGLRDHARRAGPAPHPRHGAPASSSSTASTAASVFTGQPMRDEDWQLLGLAEPTTDLLAIDARMRCGSSAPGRTTTPTPTSGCAEVLPGMGAAMGALASGEAAADEPASPPRPVEPIGRARRSGRQLQLRCPSSGRRGTRNGREPRRPRSSPRPWWLGLPCGNSKAKPRS